MPNGFLRIRPPFRIRMAMGCLTPGFLALSIFAEAGSVRGNIGENLTQLFNRFGPMFTMDGSTTTNDLRYRFRLPDHTVDVLIESQNGELLSMLEAHYFSTPLSNGKPPTPIVRRIMTACAPKAKWHEIPTVGIQKAAFSTGDGQSEVAILPPDFSVDPMATFTVVVSKAENMRYGGTEKLKPQPTFSTKERETPSAESQGEPVTDSTVVRLDGYFLQRVVGKNRGQIKILLGAPMAGDGTGLMYIVTVPGYWGDADGRILIEFVGGKALWFNLGTSSPPSLSFVQLCLQNSPLANFEPFYDATNLTGSNWIDRHQGFSARTFQRGIKEYWFVIDLKPPSEAVRYPQQSINTRRAR